MLQILKLYISMKIPIKDNKLFFRATTKTKETFISQLCDQHKYPSLQLDPEETALVIQAL